MPRLSDAQRRLVCAQVRMRREMVRSGHHPAYRGVMMGLQMAGDALLSEDLARHVNMLAYRIARRFGDRGRG